MTEKIVDRLEVLRKLEVEFIKPDFIRNLHKLNEELAKNPLLFDELDSEKYVDWNRATCRIRGILLSRILNAIL